MIGMINAHMIGTPSTPGEHVDWSTPDVMSATDWADLLGMSVEEYAAGAPHMIIFEVVPAPPLRMTIESVPRSPGSKIKRFIVSDIPPGASRDSILSEVLDRAGERRGSIFGHEILPAAPLSGRVAVTLWLD